MNRIHSRRMGTSFFHTKFPTRSQAEGAVLFTNTGMCPFTDSSQLQQQQTSRSPSTTPTYRQFLTSSVRPRSTRARWQGLPKVARNLTRSFFEIGHKRCNSNDRISNPKIQAWELRATLLGNHSEPRSGSSRSITRAPQHPRADPLIRTLTC